MTTMSDLTGAFHWAPKGDLRPIHGDDFWQEYEDRQRDLIVRDFADDQERRRRRRGKVDFLGLVSFLLGLMVLLAAKTWGLI